jgi:hypothetical protein
MIIELVNFATLNNLIVKITMSPHSNSHKFTLTPPGGKIHNQIDSFYIQEMAFKCLYVLFFGGAKCDIITVWWLQRSGRGLQ